jgi:catechol 2,3-dioxygenase-like lactoylglutathione lyase family enzyme
MVPGKDARIVSPVSVRYIVHDVDAAIDFYSSHLEFSVVMRPAAQFAILARGELRLLLSVPSEIGGGGQAMPDGRSPEPGGRNRILLDVDDLVDRVDRLRRAGVHFRNEIVHGVGGDQILIDDPSGNPIELFQYHG